MIRVVIDDVPTSWVDIQEMKDDGPKEIPSRWGITLQVIDLDISREDAIDYEKNRQVFELVAVPTDTDLDAVKEALADVDDGIGFYDEVTPTLETLFDAARAYVQMWGQK